MRLHLSIIAVALLARLGTACLPSSAAPSWPPTDPGEPMAKVALDEAFALSLREAKGFGELQAAAGSHGHLTEVVLDGDAPHVVYAWTGAGGKGAMRVFVYEGSKDFGAIITAPGAAGPIVLNNFGAFICPSCSPPVNSCGHRPSWVPHDLHWDVFDCGCTLTGPQSLRSGSC